MITIPEKIETRKTPLKGEALREAVKNVRHFFDEDYLTLSEAERLYSDFFGRGMRGKFKREKMENAVNDFLFTEAGSFDKWFFSLPPDSQKILYAVVFEEFIFTDILEKTLNIKINTTKRDWRMYDLSPRYKLPFLVVSGDGSNYSCCIGIKPLYRSALLPQFTPPPEASLENCVCNESPDAAPYNNTAEIAESMPLFHDALNECLREEFGEKNLYRSFLKKTVNRLYEASGFAPFPFETKKALALYSPAAADLFGHFLLFSANFLILARPENTAEALRDLLKQFFGLTGKRDIDGRCWITETMEYNIFFNHLGKSMSTYTEKRNSDIFSLRHILMDSLVSIAEDGRTFDVGALVKQLKYSGKHLSFFRGNESQYLKINAEKINISGMEIKKNHWEIFHPAGSLTFDFVEKPLFLGYFYLCASLGILEITQAPPPLILERGNKKLPASIFDSLKTVKITEFGRWCLGISSEAPKMTQNKYEAIADNELFLVTVRGKSLERTIFLDRIGEKLGTDRWRINPSTFISGCENKTHIEDRVKKFHNLIEKNPAPHWEKLFKMVLDRTDFFDKQALDAIVYQLPSDTPLKREASAELLADPELRGVAMRAEGGLLVVPYWNQKRFYDLLAAHGISHFETHT
ncbi:MAG: hypothetical protein LBF83_08865 [Spirochaetaceae bacterium]|jgi:hypothetical protein|nr:hypothetical protein [Spirochaetaceae bacterium]